jgi:hypothetical protein
MALLDLERLASPRFHHQARYRDRLAAEGLWRVLRTGRFAIYPLLPALALPGKKLAPAPRFTELLLLDRWPVVLAIINESASVDNATRLA